MLLADFCSETAGIWAVLGYVVLVIKIVIPLMLIIMGMIDLGKAVISSDEKAINKAVSTLIKRFIAAVIVFFIPTIVSALFSVVTSINMNQDYATCVQCLVNVTAASGNADYHYCKSDVSIVEK